MKTIPLLLLLVGAIESKAQLQGSLPPGALRVTTETESYWEYASAPDYMPPISELRKIQRTFNRTTTEFVPGVNDWSLTVQIDSSSERKSFPEQVLIRRMEITPAMAVAFDEHLQPILQNQLPDELKQQVAGAAQKALTTGISAPPFQSRLAEATIRHLTQNGFVMTQQGTASIFSKPGIRLKFDPGNSSVATIIYELSDEWFHYPIQEEVTYYTWSQTRYLPSLKVSTFPDTLGDGTCAKRVTSVVYKQVLTGSNAVIRNRNENAIKDNASTFNMRCFAGSDQLTLFLAPETIKQFSNLAKGIQLSIIDMRGQQLAVHKLPVINGQDHYSVPNPGLSPGVYLISILADRHIYNVPFSIQN